MAKLIIFLGCTLALIDQLVKFLIEGSVKQSGTITVIPGLFDLTYVENTGAAFGAFQNMQLFFIILTIIILVIFCYILITREIKNKLFIVASILVIGGTLGNFIDRIFRGYVIDYLRVSFFPAVCNLADYSLTLGAILLIIYILFFYSKKGIKGL